jgi:hypothetical protein
MSKTKEILLDRREFTVRAALLALSGVTITVSACGGGSGNPNNPDPPSSGDKVGTISANHNHTAVISAARLAQGGDLDLDISGTAGHPHRVALTGAELTQIAAGTRVSKNSTTDDGHNHQVTFN